MCCQIDPPMLPVFDSFGNLINYQQQACPPQYVVCCRGLINILGYCIRELKFKILLLNILTRLFYFFKALDQATIWWVIALILFKKIFKLWFFCSEKVATMATNGSAARHIATTSNNTIRIFGLNFFTTLKNIIIKLFFFDTK